MTDPLIGTTLGNYRIVTELGGGAMGQVYYAEHERIGRRAAIKLLRKELASAPDMVSRFIREARAVNDIRHPNIVEITDFGEAGGVHYIVMELLEGETLEERLERLGPMSSKVAIGIASQVAAALGAAHERGIVHRDLKPENIYITNHRDYPDFVKVLDFGIAKLVGDAPKLYMTQAGAVLGTPYYMSPEQCIGEADIDQRSDIYSLGVVLYQMVTGDVPFAAETIGRLILAHLQEVPVPPRDRNPEVSPQMNALILRMLQKDPKDRFDSMPQFRAALEAPSSRPASIARSAAVAATERPPAASSQPADGSHSAPEQPPAIEAESKPVVNRLTRIVLDRLSKNKLTLPAMPTTALRALELLRSPSRNFSDVAVVVAEDPILAAQVFRVANSAMFAGTTRTTTLDKAVGRLGSRQLELLLIQTSVHQLYQSRDKRIRETYERIWDHCQIVAFLAREIATRLPCEATADEAYLAGLLHDVGKPVVGALLLDAERQVGEAGWLDHDTWLEVVTKSHRDVGVALAMAWKLPPGIAKAIRTSEELDLERGRSSSNIVCFANALAKETGHYVGVADALAVDAILGVGRRVLDIGDDTFRALLDAIAERVSTNGAAAGGDALDVPVVRPNARARE